MWEETPTLGRSGPGGSKAEKKGLNQESLNPHNGDARITKMKDGRTHLVHKAEHGVDMDTGAVVAPTLQEVNLSNTTRVKDTVAGAEAAVVAELIERGRDRAAG